MTFKLCLLSKIMKFWNIQDLRFSSGGIKQEILKANRIYTDDFNRLGSNCYWNFCHFCRFMQFVLLGSQGLQLYLVQE